MAPSAIPSVSALGTTQGPPSNTKRNLLDVSDSESDDAGQTAGSPGLKVNEEYARRFEHNKKREEKQKLEEKYNNSARNDDNASSSSDETEDEEGFLATEDLDAQISATLQAIRSKDPRVYDKNVSFYQNEENADQPMPKAKKEKPLYLQDYHREKIMRGDVGADENDDEAPQTYVQEQDAIKKSIMSEINAANGNASADNDDDDDGEEFMKRKEVEKPDANGVHPSRAAAIKVTELDVVNADKNPETYLSNFMAAKAWRPEGGSRWEAFESDDEEDEEKADQFEQAYNMRFEDPEKSNELLKSYARDITASRSVRREEKSKRKKLREAAREREDEERRLRSEEKARLKKLKLEEAEEKLAKIKQAAGATGKGLTDREWVSFLDDAWESDKWEEEMQKRFGEDYYAVEEDLDKQDGDGGEDLDAHSSTQKKKRPKKPKWDNDIDIKDLVPEFEDDETAPNITLSDSEGAADQEEDSDEGQRPSKKRKVTDPKRARLESQKKARLERSKLEALVDAKLELTDHDLLARASGSGGAGFRYREVSPQSFGMTPRDILLAPSDQALNEFAGLKKLASFRDEQRKRRDKKTLGKKARLRQWRRDNFGKDFERTGPTYGFERFASEDAGVVNGDEGHADAVEDKKKKKRKRSKGKKSVSADAS